MSLDSNIFFDSLATASVVLFERRVTGSSVVWFHCPFSPPPLASAVAYYCTQPLVLSTHPPVNHFAIFQ